MPIEHAIRPTTVGRELKMKSRFKKIGLFAKYNSGAVLPTLKKLITFLETRHHSIVIEEKSADLLQGDLGKLKLVTKQDLGTESDLVIVVGGDGSFLNAARAVVPHRVPMLGINRGRLGFLADIMPDELELDLGQILEGNYLEEERALLKAVIRKENQETFEGTALNDIVIYPGSIARMIEFEILINDHFVLRQRSDGLIASTPTGSTAYALSGGGPILYPTLQAIVIVPILPHTLSSRPIVVPDTHRIELLITENNDVFPKLSCDGQQHFDLAPGDRIILEKNPLQLILLHPKHYDYFSVLRQKLGWSTSQIKDS